MFYVILILQFVYATAYLIESCANKNVNIVQCMPFRSAFKIFKRVCASQKTLSQPHSTLLRRSNILPSSTKTLLCMALASSSVQRVVNNYLVQFTHLLRSYSRTFTLEELKQSRKAKSFFLYIFCCRTSLLSREVCVRERVAVKPTLIRCLKILESSWLYQAQSIISILCK